MSESLQSNVFESCPVCGFAWDAVPADQIASRTSAAVEAIVAALTEHATVATALPVADRWSTVEFALAED